MSPKGRLHQESSNRPNQSRVQTTTGSCHARIVLISAAKSFESFRTYQNLCSPHSQPSEDTSRNAATRTSPRRSNQTPPWLPFFVPTEQNSRSSLSNEATSPVTPGPDIWPSPGVDLNPKIPPLGPQPNEKPGKRFNWISEKQISSARSIRSKESHYRSPWGPSSITRRHHPKPKPVTKSPPPFGSHSRHFETPADRPNTFSIERDAPPDSLPFDYLNLLPPYFGA